ncbi:MAG TPA: cobalamin-binding protein [Syntrophomonadaceae bacterium]|nr:cobalamin-binding protein [Syntrophomonadaceae bacterium]
MRTRVMLLAMLTLVLVIGISGCQKKGQGQTPIPGGDKNMPFPVTLQDDAGRQVTINTPPQRLVSLVPGHTEILFALGLSDRIVGVTSYCDYPAEAKTKPQIGGFSDPSLEKIIAAQPDLVVAGDMDSQLVENLQAMNIKVLVFQPHSIEGLFSTITAMGEACGKKEQALSLVAGLRERVERVKAGVNDVPISQRPLTYYEVWYEPLTTTGPHTLIAELITLAGGKNLAISGSEDFPMINEELIVEQNPAIMVHSYGTGMDNTPQQEQILNRKGWQNIGFIKDRRIIAIDSDLITRAGPRTVDALELLARGFYPERFK